MDDLTHVTLDKLKKMTFSFQIKTMKNKLPQVKNMLRKKNGNNALQKILTQYGIANTPKNDKMPNNQIVIYINIQIL